MSTVYIELPTPVNEFSMVCRGCMAESGVMKNLSEWGLTEDFCKLTDLVLDTSEGMSELLCSNCEDALMACKRFISQCKESDVTLRNIIKAKSDEGNCEETTDTGNSVSYVCNDTEIVFSINAPNTEAKICLPCPKNCIGTYNTTQNLHSHLTRIHKVRKDYRVVKKYHCHIQSCAYNAEMDNAKYFKARKQLNQHINKVHTTRIFQCDKCNTTFPTTTDYNRHLKTCNFKFKCEKCDKSYQLHERLLVHLMRHHPELHKKYKEDKKAQKRKSKEESVSKKFKTDSDICDSPKRSFATQTREGTVKNDVTLLSWQSGGKGDYANEISTQTVFEDLLSLKSQSEDDSLFFSETVSLSDIQTQTFPLDFGLGRSNKETLTEPMSIKETQTCVCRLEPMFESMSSNAQTSTETQTHERSVRDVLFSFNSAETQTSFDDQEKLL